MKVLWNKKGIGMEIFEKTRALLHQGLETGAYPAGALAIGKGEQLLVTEYVGACGPDTLFDLASLSKVISTTMVAFRFLEEGKLKLTDRVADFFPQTPAEKAGITIFHLMTHTSGISPFFFLSREARDPEDALRAILARPLVQGVGVGPIYSCMGYILLGKILEKVGGAPLDILSQKWVFAPMDMAHTTYHPQGDVAPTEWDATTGQLIQGIVHDENARFLQGISGNAGVFSNLADVSRFAAMLSCGGTPFLRPETLAMARIDRTPQGPEHRGLGFQLAGSDKCFLGTELGGNAFGHTGFTGTSIAVAPDTGLWIVLLTNRVCPTRDNVALHPLRRLLHDTAAREFRAL